MMITDETLKLAKELTKEHDKMTIAILIIIVVLYVIMNLIVPIIINRFNHTNEIRKIKAERKLEHSESVIKQLKLLSASLSIIDHGNIEAGQQKINSLRTEIKSGDFLLPSDLANLMYKVLDYYSVVLISPTERNTNKEKDLFSGLAKEYNKIS